MVSVPAVDRSQPRCFAKLSQTQPYSDDNGYRDPLHNALCSILSGLSGMRTLLLARTGIGHSLASLGLLKGYPRNGLFRDHFIEHLL